MLLSLVLAGCAAPMGLVQIRATLRRGDVPAALRQYEDLVRRHRADRAPALRAIAETVLSRDIRGGDRTLRDRAFVAVGALGESAESLLRMLARAPEPVAARAIGALHRLGEDDLSDRLEAAVTSPYPEARAAAILWLRDEERWDDVARSVLDVDAAVRRSGLDALSVAPSLAVIETVSKRAPSVRARSSARARSAAVIGRRGRCRARSTMTAPPARQRPT